MTSNANTWLARHKRLLIAVSIPLLLALWWAFRPEKLWINQTVNEPAPFDTRGDPEPIFTGQFDGNVGGRVTVFKKPNGGRYLRLNDLRVQADPDARVELAKIGETGQAQDAAKAGFDTIDLGPLKSDPGDQSFDLPTSTDLAKYDAVVIHNKRLGTILGSAKLEPF
jgi:Electron transfer DM13